jgi:hypothetical protein
MLSLNSHIIIKKYTYNVVLPLLKTVMLLLLFIFLFRSVCSSSCLERIIFADEIVTEELQLNSLRLFLSPCTYLCGCDQNPAIIASQLLQSASFYICCQAGSSAACCWRALAKWFYLQTANFFRDLGVNEFWFTVFYIWAFWIPLSIAFVLSLPVYLLSLTKELCCLLVCSRCNAEKDDLLGSCRCAYGVCDCDCCDLERDQRVPDLTVAATAALNREAAIQAMRNLRRLPPVQFEIIRGEPDAQVVIRRPVQVNFGEVFGNPVAFFVGIFFALYAFYFTALTEQINRRNRIITMQ